MNLVLSAKQKLAVVGSLISSCVLLLILGTTSGASAATSCSASAFTVNGVFDLNGYLACQAALGAGLPQTGSNTLQIAGIALGLLAIGIAALVVTNRERRRQAL